jgi:hypothetical protein
MSSSPSAACDLVDITANESDCGRESCHILGQVVLACGDLKLWADEATITLGPGQSFAGAEARGNVVLVERETVVTCSRMTLGPDRIQGKIDAATIRIKKDPNARDEHGRPTGKNEFTFGGDLERVDADHWTIADADFTVCDCGEEPPSWRVDAREIDATLNDRATLYWPQLYINPFGLALIPVTPPLLPLSVPLRKRAPGFLAPQIRFFGPVQEPTVDLPFFMPLGDSWDVTLAPGVRTDWGAHRLTPPSAWGAFRLGGRLRYNPLESLVGEANVQWTNDRKHRAAKLFYKANEKNDIPAADGTPSWVAKETAMREKLTDRVSVDWKQRADITERVRWLVDAEWLSDDLIQQDFKVSIVERFADYLPSRTEVLWRQPYVVGLLAGEYLQRIEGLGAADYSNISTHDRALGQRGPALKLTLPAVSLGAGVALDADLSWVRYGAWTSAQPPTLNLGAGRTGLGYRDRLGPVRVQAGAALAALWLDSADRPSFNAVALTTDADLDLPLARSFGDFIHVVSPRLSYRGLPYRSAGTDDVAQVDERLGWKALHQGMASIEQRLYTKRGASVDEMASLVVSQPWDLTSGDALQTRVYLSWTTPPFMGGSLWSSLKPTRSSPAKEIGASLWMALGPARVGSLLTYLTPEADRLRRSIYELAASGPKPNTNQWVYSASPFASLNLWSRVSANYATDVLLPIPASASTAAGRKVGIVEHRISLAYHSPCDCWDIGALVAVPSLQSTKNLRGQITLSIAGYALGTQ